MVTFEKLSLLSDTVIRMFLCLIPLVLCYGASKLHSGTLKCKFYGASSVYLYIYALYMLSDFHRILTLY